MVLGEWEPGLEGDQGLVHDWESYTVSFLKPG